MGKVFKLQYEEEDYFDSEDDYDDEPIDDEPVDDEIDEEEEYW